MSGAPIHLRIPGDHVALESLADALDKDLLSELRDCEERLRVNEVNFEPSWGGAAADAFFEASQELRADIESSVSNYVAKVGEVIRAYAWKLKRGKGLFEGYADTASRYGLVVQGEYILAPTRRDPNDASAPCATTDIVGPEQIVPGAGSVFALFDEIAERVGNWHGENKLWIAEHFGRLFNEAPAASGLSRLLEHFKMNEPTLFTEAMAGAQHGVDAKLERLHERSAHLSEAHSRFMQDLRDNNFAVKQGEDAVSGRRLTRGLQQVEQSIVNWSKAGTVLNGLGAAGVVTATWQEVSAGESWGNIASGLGGGYVGARTGFSIGARVAGLPGSIVGGLLGGLAGSGVGKGLWDNDNGAYAPAIPLGVREGIEDWFTNPGALSANTPKQG
ncbi:hypothetical protein ACFSWE_12185 [Leucobacter albus]|uniref:WXG100 family type VII secretion target n=1 Tax=Leucobacter albus TaxID=272210 RepID=A0ABW3TRX4_9MICO